MTALKKYQRLESSGLWRASPEAQRREVIVGLREATLILSDPKTEMALTQWSLPAIERSNPDSLPAIYLPGADDGEQLEIDDLEMIEALETVHVVLERRKPHPGRLRGLIISGIAASVLALAVFWLPARLISYTASVLPSPTRDAIGAMALRDIERLTGTPCDTPEGKQSEKMLAARLAPTNPPRILVLREGLKVTAHLPGNIILLPQDLLNQTDGADAVAGYVLAELYRSRTKDPASVVLNHAGLVATIRLLATGELPVNSLAGYGEALLESPEQTVDPTSLLPDFKAAEVSSSAYALSLDATGAKTLPLIEGDPFLAGSPHPVLPDGNWLALQQICNG